MEGTSLASPTWNSAPCDGLGWKLKFSQVNLGKPALCWETAGPFAPLAWRKQMSKWDHPNVCPLLPFAPKQASLISSTWQQLSPQVPVPVLSVNDPKICFTLKKNLNSLKSHLPGKPVETTIKQKTFSRKIIRFNLEGKLIFLSIQHKQVCSSFSWGIESHSFQTRSMDVLLFPAAETMLQTGTKLTLGSK